MENQWNAVEPDEEAFSDAMGYVVDWVTTPGRSVTMLAQLMIVSAKSFDGMEALTVLANSIREDMQAEAN